MVLRDDGLNPKMLKTAICKKPVFTVDDLLATLAVQDMTTTELREAVMEKTGMSQSKFYELSLELKKLPGVSFDETKRLWTYKNPNKAKLI